MTKTKAQATIGILLDNYGPYQKRILEGVQSSLESLDLGSLCIVGRELQPSYCENTIAYAAANDIYELAAHYDLQGLIVLANSLSHNISQTELECFLKPFQHIPMVVVGMNIKAIPSVIIDNESGMTDLVRHLCSNPKNQRFAFIRGFDNADSQDRERVLRSILKENKLELDDALIRNGKFITNVAFGVTDQLLTQNKAIDVIVAANDAMALGAMQALQKHGLEVPYDVRVVGFDDSPQSQNVMPPLTTVRQDVFKIGKLAAEQVLKIQRKEPVEDTLVVKTELLIRNSCSVDKATKASPVASKTQSLEQQVKTALAKSGFTSTQQQRLRSSFLKSLKTVSSAFLASWQSELKNSVQELRELEPFEQFLNHIEVSLKQPILSTHAERFAYLLRRAQKHIAEKTANLQSDLFFTASKQAESQRISHFLITAQVNLEDILLHTQRSLIKHGIKRCFIALYDTSQCYQQPTTKSNLALVLKEQQHLAFSSDSFLSADLLPAELRAELSYGMLLLEPLYVAKEHLGYMLIDPSGADKLDYESLAHNISVALRNSRQLSALELHSKQLENANQELVQLANYDPLTGLPNRSLFKTQLERAFRKADEVVGTATLFFLDLDGFKDVNDSLGHDAGDELLCLVAQRLKHKVRSHDTVARLGRDEFTIILNNLNDPGVAERTAQHILQAFKQPFQIAQHSIHVSPSIGVAGYPKDGEDSETLIKNADTAMYVAKASGKNRYHFYTSDLNVKLSKNINLENSMKQALNKNELEMHYQARVDLKNQNITGFEALMRWKHNGQYISPEMFIPLAEKTDFFSQLGQFALQAACKQAKNWHNAGQARKVAVNLSVKHLQQKDLVQQIQNTLTETQLDPEWLELEITERATMTNIEQNIRKLTALRDLGIQLSIDDFGTAYSSLNDLKRLPVTSLKIDKSFIKEISTENGGSSADAAIIKTIVAVGKSMGFQVIAEGIETETQNKFLQSLDCNEAQGFLFSHPLPANEATAFLRTKTSRQALTYYPSPSFI